MGRVHGKSRRSINKWQLFSSYLFPESAGPWSSVMHALDDADDGDAEDAVIDDGGGANCGRMRDSSASTADVATNADADAEEDAEAPNTQIGWPNSGAACGIVTDVVWPLLPPEDGLLCCAAANDEANRASALPVPAECAIERSTRSAHRRSCSACRRRNGNASSCVEAACAADAPSGVGVGVGVSISDAGRAADGESGAD